MRFVLFLFRVEYVSVELCQQFRPSIMHRVGPTGGGWVAFSECSPMRSVLQRDPPPQGPKQSYLSTHRHVNNTQAWIFFCSFLFPWLGASSLREGEELSCACMCPSAAAMISIPRWVRGTARGNAASDVSVSIVRGRGAGYSKCEWDILSIGLY